RMGNPRSRLGLPARYVTLVWVGSLFLLINVAVRLGLVVFEAEPANFLPWRLGPILVVGALYDLAALAYVLVPFALLALLCPDSARGRRAYAVLAGALLFVALFAMLFTSVAEGLFWNEFSSRFNFIAVDYLIYTREVLGNIRESYPVGLLLAAVAATAMVLFAAIASPLWRAANGDGGSLRVRLSATAVLLALPPVAFLVLGDAPREALPSPSSRELAGNGYYEFARA